MQYTVNAIYTIIQLLERLAVSRQQLVLGQRLSAGHRQLTNMGSVYQRTVGQNLLLTHSVTLPWFILLVVTAGQQ